MGHHAQQWQVEEGGSGCFCSVLVVRGTSGLGLVLEHISAFVMYKALILNIIQFNETQERNKRSARMLLSSLCSSIDGACGGYESLKARFIGVILREI